MKNTLLAALLVSGVISASATGAHAQDSEVPVAAEDGLDEIIVTARKRDETAISVPVVLTAVPSAELQRRAMNTVADLATVVPTLMVADSGGRGAGIGSSLSIRGLSSSRSTFAEGAISTIWQPAIVAKRRLPAMFNSTRLLGKPGFCRI